MNAIEAGLGDMPFDDNTTTMPEDGTFTSPSPTEVPSSSITEKYDMDGLIDDMLSKGMTLNDLPDDMQNDLLADDALVHYIGKSSNAFYDTAEESQQAIDGLLTDLGAPMEEYRDRASAGQRFQNGATLAVLESYNGLDNLADTVTDTIPMARAIKDGASAIADLFGSDDQPAYKADLSNRMEKILQEQTHADSRLFKSMYPAPDRTVEWREDDMLPSIGEEGIDEPYDIATTAGEVAPNVVASYGGGSIGSRVLSKASKVVPIPKSEVGKGIKAGLTGEPAITRTMPVTRAQGAVAGEIAGDTGVTAMRANSEGSEQTMADVLISLTAGVAGAKALGAVSRGGSKVKDAGDVLSAKANNTGVDELVDSFQSNRGKGVKADPLKMDEHKFSVSQDGTTHTIKQTTEMSELGKAVKSAEGDPTKLLKDLKSNKGVSEDIRKWATLVSKENTKEAMTRWGVNALMLYMNMPAGAAMSVITSPSVQNIGKKLLSKIVNK